MGPYDKQDAADETGVSPTEVERAWHNARTDDQRSENPTVDYGNRPDTIVDLDGNIDDEE